VESYDGVDVVERCCGGLREGHAGGIKSFRWHRELSLLPPPQGRFRRTLKRFS
jgi:hypothetical protein